MSSIREVLESPVTMGVREEVAWALNTAPWGGAPTNPVQRVLQGTTDVTSTVMPGTPTVAGDYIVLPVMSGIEALEYRVEVQFDCAGQHVEAFGLVLGEE